MNQSGLYTAAVGHHFARPVVTGFWARALCRRIHRPTPLPFYEREFAERLRGVECGLCEPSARADQLSRAELHEGGKDIGCEGAPVSSARAGHLGLGAYRTSLLKNRNR